MRAFTIMENLCTLGQFSTVPRRLTLPTVRKQWSCAASSRQQNMTDGFSILRRDNIWVLRVQDSCTTGTFGSLDAAMSAAYALAFDGTLKDWSADRDGEAA